MKPRLLACAALILALGCHAGNKGASSPQNEDGDEELAQRVEDIDTRLRRIEALLQQALEGPPQPDPQAVYAVPIDGFPAQGPRDAKVTVVMAYEFACGYCYRVRPTLQQLIDDYPGALKVVYKPFIVHAEVAIAPAMAACAAERQGKFQPMENAIWEKGFLERDLSEDKMTALAQEVGLDMERYRKDVADESCMDALRSSATTLSQLGVNGTPAFFINGRHLSGAQPIAAFKKIVDEELAKADRALSEGASLETYYQSAVLEGGKKAL